MIFSEKEAIMHSRAFYFIFSISIILFSVAWIARYTTCRMEPHKELSRLVRQGGNNIIPIAVIGSGPSGLSAALYGARSHIYTIVFMGDKPGGLLTETTDVENWPGITEKTGPKIMKELEAQASQFGAKMVYESVESVNFSQWPFTITTTEGDSITALTVIIATGASPRLLGIKGEKAYWGKGVTTCAICDAPFYEGEKVVVIGGGDSAAEEAMQLAPYASKVTILVRKDKMRASAQMQDRLKGYANIEILYQVEPQEVVGDGEMITAIRLLNNKTNIIFDYPISGVFIAIGHIPNTKLFKDHLKTDNHGYLAIKGRSQTTSIPGIYAAGDVEDSKYRQAGVASGSGIRAGLDAVSFLTKIGFNTEVAKQLTSSFYELRTKKSVELRTVSGLGELEQEINEKSIPVFVDFYTDYCPTCLQMLPLFEQISGEYEDRILILKVNADKSKDIVKKFNVLKVPHVLIFKNGELTARINSIMNKKELTELVKRFI